MNTQKSWIGRIEEKGWEGFQVLYEEDILRGISILYN